MALLLADLRRLGITRARVDRATACHYRDSRRIVVVADEGDFGAALEALIELADKVAPDDAGVAAVIAGAQPL